MIIPIFITIKTNSVRSPNKNKELLPYSYQYLLKQNLIDNTIVIVDSKELSDFTYSIGFKNVYIEDKPTFELYSIYQYINKTNMIVDWFIHFAVTQPFKDENLIKKGMNEISDNIDLITSYNVTTDRSIFYIDDNDFVIDSKERKGCLCKEHKMCDGAIYFIKYDFLKKCCKDINKTNNIFWNYSRKKFIKNESVFFDKDTVDDMIQFKNTIKQLSHEI